MSEQERTFCVFGNAPGCKVFRPGALLMVGYPNGMRDRIEVLGVSRGGQYKCIYRKQDTVQNLRVKYVPHRFLSHPKADIWMHTKEQALDHLKLFGSWPLTAQVPAL